MPRLPTPGPLVIVGAGGFGRECLDIVEALDAAGAELEFLGFLDDSGGDTELLHRRGAACLGPVAAATADMQRFVIAIGSGDVRARIADELDARGLRAPILIHPQATLGSDCRVGDGTILNAGARATTNIELGRHVQLHANATVGHDSVLGDFVSVYPGATVSGNVRLGVGVTVGTGANVLPGVEVGAGAIIGAGAVVVNDVATGTTVIGIPARPLRDRT